jgi:capsular exopolysaccharide synthesis family protein
MLITSAVPREGKTTTGVNMAIGFAQVEDRVLLVDGDLRRGEIHRYFNLPRGRGLADILLGEASPEEVVNHTEVPKLDIITTGDYPTNPAELLLGWRLKEFLDWAHKHYNRVIFDGPPVMGIADSAILGSAVDGVLLIIWAGRTSRRYVRVAKMTAASRGAKIIGFVLNNLEPGRVGFYHYYPYYYSYYYRGYYTDQDGPTPGGKPGPAEAANAAAAQAAGAVSGLEVPLEDSETEKDIEDVY